MGRVRKEYTPRHFVCCVIPHRPRMPLSRRGFAFCKAGCGYAVTVAKNAAIDLLRAQRHTVSFSDEWEPPAPTDSAGEYAYLVSLVRALPEGYRRVLELKLVEEQSNQEIARRLGLNESTVATRIQRGKAMLRERLKKEGYCYE